MQARGKKTRTADPADASQRAQTVIKLEIKKSPGCRLVSGVLIMLEGEKLTTFIKENKEMECILQNPHKAAQHSQN